MSREPDARRAARLLSPGFSGFLAGQTLSQLGDRLDQLALIAVLGAGRNAAAGTMALAVLAVAMTLPVLLFGALAGVVSDRWNRKGTLILSDLARAGLVASIPAVYRLTDATWPVNAIVFAVYLTSLLYNTAKTAVVPDIVGADRLLAANAFLTSTGRVATVSGVVFGGLIIEWSGWRSLGWRGYDAGFYLDALTYVLSAVFLLAIAIPRHTRMAASAGDPRGALVVAWRDMAEARLLIRSNQRIRFVMASTAVLAATAGGVYALAPVMMQTGLHLSIGSVGAIGGILAAGVLVGAATTPALKSLWRRPGTITAGLGGVGVLVVGVSLADSFAAYGVLAFLGGVFVAPVMVLLDTEVQEAVSQSLRGRVAAVREIVVNVAFVAAAVAAGLAVLGLERLSAGGWHRTCLAAVGLFAIAASVAALLPARWARRESTTDACPSGLSV